MQIISKRDPITNRCRRKSCKPGKTRDVSTKRCRIKKSPKRKSPKRKSPKRKSPPLTSNNGVIPNYLDGLRLRSKSDGSDYGMGRYVTYKS